jgi:hypothetical protein
MPLIRTALLALLILAQFSVTACGQDDDVAARQKKRGVENWKRALESDPGLVVEMENFIVLAPKSFDEEKVRALGESMDGTLKQMNRALGIGENRKPLWVGKMTVYLFAEKKQMNSLIRSVEKRRPADAGLGSFYLKGEQVHIAACNPAAKDDLPLEQQTFQHLAEASLTRFAGDGNGIPEWVVRGWLDACAWEANPKQREVGFKEALGVADHKKTPKGTNELFAGALTGKELFVVRASLLDFLAFGPAKEKFPEWLRAFKVERGKTKTIAETLTSLDQNPTKLNRDWRTYVRKGGK